MRLRRSSDSDGVFLSLREAVKKYGAPETIYLDNGREFLSSDIGGRGRRKKDINADYGKTLFERLKIKMVNAKVANGRAKIAERQFNTITNQFARMIKTYCGNKPTTRPEGHLDILKYEKNIPLLSEIENELREYIEGYYNNIESNAEGLEKTSPNKAYEKYLLKKRTLTDTMLDELLLRTTKLQTYKRNGVYVQIGNTKVYFYNSDITMKYLDKKVYVRYDPDKLTEVIIEDEKGRYIGKAKREITGGYGLANDTEAIKYLGKTNKKLEKIVKDYKKVEEMIDVPSVREVINKKSKDMIRTNNEIYYAKVIEPILNNNINEKYTNKKVVGAENITENMIDFERMIENARKIRRSNMYEYLLEVFKKSRCVDRDTLLSVIYSIGDVLNENEELKDDTILKVQVAHMLNVADRLKKEREDEMISIKLDKKQAILLKYLLNLEKENIDSAYDEYEYTDDNVSEIIYKTIDEIISQLKDVEEFNDRVDVIDIFKK